MNNTNPGNDIDLETTLNALGDSAINAKVYYGLSGLDEEGIAHLAPVWSALSPDYRRKLLLELTEASESNFELNYFALGHLALGDEDADVRAAAVELLWEDETLTLMNRLIRVVADDEAAHVRATAASALGRFVLLGELGDLAEYQANKALDAANAVLNNLDEAIDVRRRALEAVANSSQEFVAEAIGDAYNHADRRMQISAVFAMGRSYDEQWTEAVLRELDSNDPEMRYEAARSAGELELEEAIPRLKRLVFDDDREVKEVAIWSLGEIGGKEALRTLERLAADAVNSDDEEMIEAIEDALSAASLGSGSLYLMRFDDEN